MTALNCNFCSATTALIVRAEVGHFSLAEANHCTFGTPYRFPRQTAYLSFYQQKIRQLLEDRQLAGLRLNAIEAAIDGYKPGPVPAMSRRVCRL
jgi:hypothetical protein